MLHRRRRIVAFAAASAVLALPALPKTIHGQPLDENVAPFETALEETENYDPLEGMDPDGRIPRPEMPSDLPNPHRWRYIPEGRIKPGNVFQRLLVSSFVAPLVFVESDIGAGGGIALTDIDFRQQRRREFAGISSATPPRASRATVSPGGAGSTTANTPRVGSCRKSAASSGRAGATARR